MRRIALLARHTVPLAALMLLAGCGRTDTASTVATRDVRPNILVIVADDLGYTDTGAYGSDIRTPNIDRLAAEGILFTNFHTAPMCAPDQS
jgi:arylsulfatase